MGQRMDIATRLSTQSQYWHRKSQSSGSILVALQSCCLHYGQIGSLKGERDGIVSMWSDRILEGERDGIVSMWSDWILEGERDGIVSMWSDRILEGGEGWHSEYVVRSDP